LATRLAEPFILLAAVLAVFATAKTPFYSFVKAETVVANGTVILVGVAILAESTIKTDLLVATVAYNTV
jgi:hypothetical protein